jgi:hypothetical protein
MSNYVIAGYNDTKRKLYEARMIHLFSYFIGESFYTRTEPRIESFFLIINMLSTYCEQFRTIVKSYIRDSFAFYVG